ncbi:MAG: glutamate dehydrogenase [Caulobacterales bacterium 32-69-10]|nr:MAG: glutamate dehydrogenase [Caulobacterales bacterium 32-69-10]
MDASAIPVAFPFKALSEAFAAALGVKALSPPAADFVLQATGHMESGDLPGLTTQDLAAALAAFWTSAETRKGPKPGVKLHRAVHADGRPAPLDLLEVAQDDGPFLVDSIMGELAAHGLEIRAMIHPVVAVPGRDRPQSLIMVALSPVGEDRRDDIRKAVAATLADVHAAVDDFPAMTALMRRAIFDLGEAPVPPQPYGLDEHLAFLRWLTADRFVFLGARSYDYPRDAKGDYLCEEPTFDAAEGLGVLRDPKLDVLRRESEPAFLVADTRAYLAAAPAVTVAKSNLVSKVHRRVHLDYIGVRRYAPDGAPIGEVRFVGLFTVEAYEEQARALPLVRRKIEQVQARAGDLNSTHAERRLRHILETYPRDELFQIDEDSLLRTVMGVLHLYDRPRVRLFEWKDPFGRFESVLLFVPRDRYHADTPRKAADILARAWNGRVSAIYPRFADEALARIHVIVGLDAGEHPEPDLPALEAEIAEALRGWTDRFEAAIRGAGAPPGEVAATLARHRQTFPIGYRDHYGAAEALADLPVIDAVARGEGEPLRVRPFRLADDADTRLRFKLYVPGGAAPLSDVLPIVEHMGLRALEEVGFATRPGGGGPDVWVHEYLLEDAYGRPLAFDDIQAAFEAAFIAVWTGLAESDGFNRLVIELGVSWREAALIRALARWRQQSGLDPTQAVQEAALRHHPGVARLILDLFRVKFDPAVHADLETRREQSAAVHAEIEAALQQVASLDDDRVLRRLADAVQAMTRTNYFQLGEGGAPKPYISFKIASREVESLPDPKPYREVFVASRRVDGVHTRFGPVARGGLRWSDRRDDFRTEVLGLVKAQQVKNAVIVPVGAKGGFYPKQLPRQGGPDAVRAEAVEAYKAFLFGVLDLTDNLGADGEVIHPQGVVIHDGDDPYLVVAADKGTATFSDIANGVAQDYGFWLDDAFASGGSKGYDHKAMGITARGAWEAVKRHFREMGKDIQTEPFTCIGVGDMSGDVFGNGMLLSRATKLVAAFDHRHIFLDPDPDPRASWAERSRLFALPRSSWADYDAGLLSPGGGIFPRSAKTVPLSPEVRALLGVDDETLAPADLIRAVLKTPAELLYLGGVGTYVKAPGESHADVADKANDPVRIDGTELRVKVVGEGANLGFTQAGRIAFARSGGRINTDAIDNSAGVDTSDHEVNIKILTGQAIKAGTLKAKDRDKLLAGMTDDIAAHVLAHNYAQTLALSLQEAEAATELDGHARFMAELVATGRLDRKVEGLPGPAALIELKGAGKGLTRPELAVLLAYAKLELSAEIVAGPAPDDPYFEATLKAYFPDALARFEPEMKRHRLRREIVSTGLANAMVDMVGPTFATRVQSALGCDAAVLATAFEAARKMFRLNALWAEVAALDLKVPAATQMALFQAVAQELRAQTYWLARRAAAKGPEPVQAMIDGYREAVDALHTAGPALLADYDRLAVEARAAEFVAAGAPEALAAAVAALGALRSAVEIADLASEAGWAPEPAARLFNTVGAVFGFDRLRGAAAGLTAVDGYERRAARQLIVDMVGEQAAIARAVMNKAKGDADPQQAIAAWSEPRRAAVERARAMLDEIESGGEAWTFARLALAHSAVREVAAG